MPGEVYCHSLTDPSILGDVPGRHPHAHLLRPAHPGHALRRTTPRPPRRSRSSGRSPRIDQHLAEPLADCLARDGDGNPCLEAKIPQDVERELAMPGGHIFHGDLAWPWAPARARLDTPAQQWGVQTELDAVLLCGSGAAAAAPSPASAATTPRTPSWPRSEFGGAGRSLVISYLAPLVATSLRRMRH